MKDFKWVKECRDGIYYFLIGQSTFFRKRGLWKYAWLSLFLMFLVYVSIWVAGTVYLLPWLTALLQGISHTAAGKILLCFSKPLFWGAFLLLIWTTQSILYQCFGSFIFDELSDYYEKTAYGYTCCVSPQQKRKAGTDSFLLSCKNACLSMGLLLLSLVSFGWAVIICMPLIGYMLGISYFQACAVNHGIRVKTLLPAANKHFLTISVFGVCSALVQSFPFSAFLLTPGFIIGGCHFFWDKLVPELNMKNNN